ncbi:hypothetical protein FHW83_005393 [Duganella sp. SG902]|uniref:hypothetical protein n=1 Tax=Duganella sp. SG902 TaxID=2587016 RepID=UPI00159E1197|nr:hypothetical protein [Duganella sp. SG902]NVM79552.1 hypothetical protein [Duganella sp. SG902]
MSATTYNTFADNGYFANIANAARQLIAALFAVQPVVSQRNKEETIWWLNRLAADSELHSPNLAAELRYFASRG